MGAPRGNRNAAGKRSSRTLGVIGRKIRRGRNTLGSTHNQIRNFSSPMKGTERRETYKRLPSKAKKIFKNVRKGNKKRYLSKGL